MKQHGFFHLDIILWGFSWIFLLSLILVNVLPKIACDISDKCRKNCDNNFHFQLNNLRFENLAKKAWNWLSFMIAGRWKNWGWCIKCIRIIMYQRWWERNWVWGEIDYWYMKQACFSTCHEQSKHDDTIIRRESFVWKLILESSMWK